MFTTNNAPQTLTCPKSKTETGEKQSKQQRHQNDVNDIVVVSSSLTPTSSHTPPQCPHFRLREGKRSLGHNN